MDKSSATDSVGISWTKESSTTIADSASRIKLTSSPTAEHSATIPVVSPSIFIAALFPSEWSDRLLSGGVALNASQIAIRFGAEGGRFTRSAEIASVSSTEAQPQVSGFAKLLNTSTVHCVLTPSAVFVDCYFPVVLGLVLDADERVVFAFSSGSLFAAPWCPTGVSGHIDIKQQAVSTLQSAITNVVTSTATVSTVAGAVGGSSSSDAQMLVILSMMSCASPAEKKQVGSAAYLVSPFFFDGPWYMSLGNLLICTCFLLLHGLLTILVSRRMGLTFQCAAEKVRFPNISVFLLNILSQGVVLGSSAALWEGGTAAAGAIAVLLLYVSILTAGIWFARNCSELQFYPYTIFQTEPRWKRVFLPTGYWLPSSLRTRYGAFFSSCRSKSLLHVVPLSNFTIVFVAAASPSVQLCNAQFGVLFTLLVISAVSQLILRPHRSFAESFWSAASLVMLGCVVALQIMTLRSPENVSKAAKPTVLLLQTIVVLCRSVHQLVLSFLESQRWRAMEPPPVIVPEPPLSEKQAQLAEAMNEVKMDDADASLDDMLSDMFEMQVMPPIPESEAKDAEEEGVENLVSLATDFTPLAVLPVNTEPSLLMMIAVSGCPADELSQSALGPVRVETFDRMEMQETIDKGHAVDRLAEDDFQL